MGLLAQDNTPRRIAKATAPSSSATHDVVSDSAGCLPLLGQGGSMAECKCGWVGDSRYLHGASCPVCGSSVSIKLPSRILYRDQMAEPAFDVKDAH